MNIRFFLILMTLIFTETVALYFIEKTVKTKTTAYFFLGIFIYVFVPILYYFLLKNGYKVGLANVLFNAGTNITVLLVGYLFYEQKITSLQAIGILVSLLGLWLLK